VFNVCARCGAYHADKLIDPDGPYAICPNCGYPQPFVRLPLLCVGGPSGGGKSAVCRELVGQVDDAVLLEGDILWRPEIAQPEDGYRSFFEMWLRVAKNVGQSGRPVVVFNAGMGVPENIELCVERRYFSRVHYAALVCDDEALAERLRARPAWRDSSDLAWIRDQVRFNQWFRKHAATRDSPITLVDTTELAVEEAADQVGGWIRSVLVDEGLG
jgi:hypothetical protein